MTFPHPGDIGRAEIEVVADTGNFASSAKRGVEEQLHGVDPELKKAGEEWGDTASKSFGQRLKERVPNVLRDFVARFRREKIKEKIHIDADVDVDKDRVRSFVHKIADELEGEVASVAGPGGPFNKVGQLIGDAVGAGFNVSGKSPLIMLLIPVVGAIAALILAVVEGVNGLIGALLTLPSIFAAIAVQLGVLYLIFKAVSPVISAVLNAQNAKELHDALMGVAQPIREFALSLIPIKEFFELLSKSAAVEFFTQLGSVVKDIFNANSRELFFGLIRVAGALGEWFGVIGKAFTSKQFTKFLDDLFKQIDTFLDHNGPIFEKFLEQLFTFLDKMLDPANALGALFTLLIKTFGDWLEMASKDPKFLDWIENRMPILLLDLGDAIGAILELIKTLFNDIDQQGGGDFLPKFTAAVKALNDIFESEAGQLAIRGLIQLIELLGLAFFGLVVAIVSVIAFLEKLGEWIVDAGKAIGEFFAWLWHKISSLWSGDTVKGLLDNFTAPFAALPSKLYNIGVNMIKSFIAGVLHMRNPAATVAGQVIEAVAGAFPSSPAKYGAFSGKGAPYERGQSTMDDFTKGLMAASDQATINSSTAMSNVNFGTGAVIANFYGAQPSPDQARGLGTAVGNGIGDQLLARNARLAVRTM